MKKRRLKKHIQKNKRTSKARSGKDCHHFFFCRKDFGGKAKGKLRQHWYAKAYIPKDTLHRKIHEALSHVPVPKESSITFALDQMEMLESYGAIHGYDSFEKRLKLWIALFDCIEQPTADALRVQLEIANRFYKPP